ncbi:MAG: hypothetical protein K5776_11335, partial [Lachnospiraceae bacterium]|nr:hypothetical protein [Lachnospiraceae bacterium]
MKETVESLKRKLKEKDYIIFLYRWLYECDLSWDASEEMCDFLLDNIDELEKHIPMLTYAGTDNSTEKGWKLKQYRNDSRDGFTLNAQKDEIFEKKGKHRREENYLAMEIFRMGRPEEGDLKSPKRIDNLGYILDYEMPIGGTKSFLTMNMGENCKFDKEKNGYKYGIIDPNKTGDKLEDRLFTPGKCDLIAYDNKQFTILELKTKNNKEPMLRAVMEAYTYIKLLDKEKASNSF